mgnify:FL=1
MRNLKKVLAVILTVALLASMMMVPALAAVSNEAEAKALKAIGLFKGYGDDLGLTDKLTREQGMILVIRAMGAEEAALAMTDAEVDAALADVTDLNTIGTWAGARNYAAYALKAGLTKGISTASLVYGGQLDFAGDQLVILLLRAMGYSQAEKDNCWDLAVKAGFVSAGGAVALQLNNALIRDDAAGVLHSAVKNGVCADGKTLIEKLIASGAVDEAAAAAAGFIAAKPDTFEVVDVEANNLVRVAVTFNKEVDKDSIDDGDFDVDSEDVDADDVSLSDDLMVATLTVPVMGNGDEITIAVSGLTDVDGNELVDFETEFTPIDVKQPTIKSIEFTGPTTAKITFSEPIDEDNSNPEIIIDGGIYSASAAPDYDNKTAVEIDLGTELDEDTHSFKIKGFQDFAGYSNIVTTIDAEYVAIDNPPSVSVKEATQSYVVLEFERPVTDIEAEDFYQSYSNWKPIEVQNEKGDALVTASDWTDVVRLVFTDAECLNPTDDDDDDKPLPVGKTKIVVVDEAVEDRWGNEIDGDVVLYANITADTTKPTVTKIKVESEKEVRVYFSESVNAEDAEDEDNYTIKDSKGKVVSSSKWSLTYNSSDKYVAITFFSELDDGDYTITIEAIADTSISKNTLDTVTLEFDISDITAEISKTTVAWVDSEKVLYVKYPKAMSASSVLNKDNYRLADTDGSNATITKLPDNVKLTMFTSKIVKIKFPANNASLDGQFLTIGRVTDAAGNAVTALATVVEIKDEEAPTITKVKKIAENKFELTVDQELKSIAAGAIEVDPDGLGTGIAPKATSYKFVNDGDETTITITVPDTHKHAGTEAVTSTYVISVVGAIKSVTGVEMTPMDITAGAPVFEDGVAPKLAKTTSDDAIVFAYDADNDDRIDHVILKYSEDIAAGTVSKYTYGVSGYDVKAVTVVSASDMSDVVTAIGGGLSTSVDGKYVVITLDEIEEGTDTDVKPVVTQKYAIEDVAGNELASSSGVKGKSAEVSATLIGSY